MDATPAATRKRAMRFRIKVEGRETISSFPSMQAAFEAAQINHPEARSIGVFCLRG